jgi:hypothetical protein
MVVNPLQYKGFSIRKLSVGRSIVVGMELLLDARPAYMMSGEEAVAALDVLHAEAARVETRRLQVLGRLDETGYTKEISGQDTVRFVATRHRLNRIQVQRDLNLANALHKYPTVSEALPDLSAPAGDDSAVQYADLTGEPADRQVGEGKQEGGELPVLLHPAQAEAIVSALEAVPKAAMVAVERLQAAEDQMVEAARHLAPADLKRLGRQVRDILDTDGPEPAEEAARRREALRLTNADQGVKFSGFLANENAELFKTAIEAAAKPHKTVDGERDPRSLEKRQADALSDVLAVAAGSGELPGHGGVKPHITVTMDLDDLLAKGREATGDLQFGEGLSASAVRRLACDAGVIPIVLGSDSEPLDVGREARYVTKGMRRALNRRDKGCVVCGIPPRYCHAHHIVSWLDGGPTSLANLVLVCGLHHIGVHAGHYTATITNGKAHVTRPTWADPPRTTWTATSRSASTSTSRSAGASTSRPAWAATPGAASRPAGANTLHTTGTSPAAQGKTADRGRGAPGTGFENDPFWGQGLPDRTLRPVRAFPHLGDPPPLAANQPADFDPWGPETLDTG